jgi:hypothetical protein
LGKGTAVEQIRRLLQKEGYLQLLCKIEDAYQKKYLHDSKIIQKAESIRKAEVGIDPD